MNQGRVVALKDGNWRNEPDFVKALELFRRFTREFTKGESRYFEQAQAQIKNITEEQVGVSVSHFFLPTRRFNITSTGATSAALTSRSTPWTSPPM